MTLEPALDSPFDGMIVGVLDESSPSNTAGGVAYVVTVSAILSADAISGRLATFFDPPRRRPFHWTSEGPVARHRMLDLIIDTGVVASAYFSHVSRRGQTSVRNEMLPRASRWAAGEGIGHLMIEASDGVTISRDRSVLLDTFRSTGGVPFSYDWRAKSEPLLWVADAIAGAVGEFVVDKDRQWFDKLAVADIVNLHQHP